MNQSVITLLKLLLSAFSKASLTARLSIVISVVLGYFIYNLREESRKELADINYNWKIESARLNERIVSCHEARIKDINSLFDKMRGIETKVQENTDEIKEVQTKKILHYYEQENQ